MSDVRLYDQGSVVGFLPRTESAEEWIAENVQAEPHQRPGLILWVEARHVTEQALADEVVAEAAALYQRAMSRKAADAPTHTLAELAKERTVDGMTLDEMAGAIVDVIALALEPVLKRLAELEASAMKHRGTWTGDGKFKRATLSLTMEALGFVSSIHKALALAHPASGACS
jgi:hypothetical protein